MKPREGEGKGDANHLPWAEEKQAAENEQIDSANGVDYSAHSRPAACNATNGDEGAAVATVETHGTHAEQTERQRGRALAAEDCDTRGSCRGAIDGRR